jgi:hypothetical protein
MGFFRRLRAERQSIEQAREIMSEPGFADMVRSGQEAYATLQTSGGMEHMLEDAQRAATLASSGVTTPAIVKALAVAASPSLGSAPPGFGPAGEAPSPMMAPGFATQTKVDVEVRPDGGTPYAASFTQSLPQQVISMLRPGMIITVRVDPSDPSSMLFWGLPAAPS